MREPYEAQELEFLDVRDENGRPARMGAGYVEDGGVVLQQDAPVVHLSQYEAAKVLGLVRAKSAAARDYRP